MSVIAASGDVLLVTLVAVPLFTHHLHVIFRWGDPSIFKYHVIVITRSWHNAKALTNHCSSSASLVHFSCELRTEIAIEKTILGIKTWQELNQIKWW